MKHHQAAFYRCPAGGQPLTLEIIRAEGDEVLEGALVAPDGTRHVISAGIPDFTWPRTLLASDEATRQSYEDMAEDYDRYALLPFIAWRSDEHAVRERMVDLLALKAGDSVLEVGCGTGRGAPHLAARVGPGGRLILQELSPRLLAKTAGKLAAQGIVAELAVANASWLPLADRSVDAAHHFGGINTFAEIARCLAEMARVVKPGGKVVVGDEGLGPWLRETEVGRIMQNSNPLLKCDPPMAQLPALATDVRLEYIMMGAFWTLEFTVAESAPEPDFHMMIPSARGGSHWTRFHGNLEGVSDEAKALAHEARHAAGKSMHDWLDEAVREAAKRTLGRS